MYITLQGLSLSLVTPVFWENPELRYVKACGTYNNHWTLKGIRSGDIAPAFFTSALYECSVSHPGPFTPTEKTASTPWYSVEDLSITGTQTPAIQPVARRYTD
jgi:hypothetical protein